MKGSTGIYNFPFFRFTWADSSIATFYVAFLFRCCLPLLHLLLLSSELQFRTSGSEIRDGSCDSFICSRLACLFPTLFLCISFLARSLFSFPLPFHWVLGKWGIHFHQYNSPICVCTAFTHWVLLYSALSMTALCVGCYCYAFHWVNIGQWCLC